MGKKIVFAKSLALTGVLSGLAIAIAVPFLAFVASGTGVIPPGGAIAITIISVLAGAPIVLVSAFFGIVIPSTVEKSDGQSVTVRGKKGNKEGEVCINGNSVSVTNGQTEETGGKGTGTA